MPQLKDNKSIRLEYVLKDSRLLRFNESIQQIPNPKLLLLRYECT